MKEICPDDMEQHTLENHIGLSPRFSGFNFIRDFEKHLDLLFSSSAFSKGFSSVSKSWYSPGCLAPDVVFGLSR